MKQVIIIGGGISGLTVAHELINKGFKVDIYEKNHIGGGMARSVRINGNIPTEHSWRGYGPYYYNTYQIMKQIPVTNYCQYDNFTSDVSGMEISIEEVEKHNKLDDLWTIFRGYVYDITEFVSQHPGGNIIVQAGGKNLETVWHDMGLEWHLDHMNIPQYLEKYKIGKLSDIKENFHGKEKHQTKYTVYDNLGKNIKFNLFRNKLTLNDSSKIIDYISYTDFPYFLRKVIEFESSGEARRKEFFKMPLTNILNNVSEKTRIYIRDFIMGPGLGLDYNKASLGHLLVVIGFSLKSMGKWKVMSQPTSEAWINPWIKYLKNKGVTFHYNNILDHLVIGENNTINKLVIKTKDTYIDVFGTDYVLCLDPFSYQKILQKSLTKYNSNHIGKIQKSDIDYLKTNIQNLNKLNIINNQIGFIIGFNKKFNYKTTRDCFVLVDSPNNITFYPQDLHFCNNFNLGDNIKSLWSGTCIMSYNKGSKYNKTLTQLDINQLKKEIIHQFLSSKDLLWFVSKYNNGHKLTENDIEIIHIFEDWEFIDNKLVSKYPKWVNTYFNEEYRLNHYTPFNNLYIGGSHTKTTINVWSMEGAVESGKKVSNLILSKYNKPLTYVYNHHGLLLFRPFQWLDQLLYTTLGTPNINILHVVLMILIIFGYNVWKKYFNVNKNNKNNKHKKIKNNNHYKSLKHTRTR